MRFGINTFLFTSPFRTASVKLLPRFRQWGFDTVEIPVEDPSHIRPGKVREALEKEGLACGSVCACMGPGRDFRGAPEEQKATMAYLKALIDQMVELDCPSLIGPVYSSVGRAGMVPYSEARKQWRMVRDNLVELAAYAGERGRTICLEPLNRFETDFINTCERGLEMIEAVGSKALRLHLDTFHMNIEEKDQARAIRMAGSRLAHFHACGSGRGTPGSDHIDWQGIARALKAVRYKGDVVIESFTTDVKVIAKAAAIWRRIEPTRDEIAVDGLAFLKKALAPARPARKRTRKK